MAAIEDSGGEELFFVQLGQVKKAKLGHVWLKSQFHWYIMMKHAGASLNMSGPDVWRLACMQQCGSAGGARLSSYVVCGTYPKN